MLSSSLLAHHVQHDYGRMLAQLQTVQQASAMQSKYRDDLISVYLLQRMQRWGKETTPILPSWKSSSRCGNRWNSADLEKI